MNIFNTGTFTWWQIGILKASVLCAGIAIGANWPGVFAERTLLLVGIAVVLGLYLAFVWFEKK
jgi:hypothetical protein